MLLEIGVMGVILLIGGVLNDALVCNGTDTEPEFVTFGGRPTLEFRPGLGAPTELCRTDETLGAGVFGMKLGTGPVASGPAEMDGWCPCW